MGPALSIRVALHHETRYRYDRRVTPAPHVVRLRPAPHTRTPITAYSLRVHPTEHFLNWQQDPFVRQLPGAHRLPEACRGGLLFEVDLVAEMTVVNPFDFFLEKDAEQYPLVTYGASLRKDLTPYLQAANFRARASCADFVERTKGQFARRGAPHSRCPRRHQST